MINLHSAIHILDELYERTHIPSMILDNQLNPVYPELSLNYLKEIIGIDLFPIEENKEIQIFIEDEVLAYSSFPLEMDGKKYFIASCALLNTLSSENWTMLPSRWKNTFPPSLIFCHIARECLSTFQNYVEMLYLSLTHKTVTDETLHITYLNPVEQRAREDNLTLRKISQNSSDFYNWEQKFFFAFENGEIQQMYSLLHELSLYSVEGLDDDTLDDMKYKFVAFITLLTRSAINNGAYHDIAFSLSDKYLAKIQRAVSIDQILLFLKESISEFYEICKNTNNYSLNVVRSIHYIEEHLYEKISLNKIAEHINVTPSYLSTLFKQEVRETITQYIWRKKIEEAQRLLLFTTKSYSEISFLLQFNSQSHFIQVFKKINGTTPKQFQMQHRKDY